MAEGEHTIISKIPRERLNQIAGRKLSELAIAVRLGADRETLEGDLAFASRLANPVTGAPITRARFMVVGHDRLRFTDPPLSALPPVAFGDADRTSVIETRVAGLVRARAALLDELSAQLRALRLEPTSDKDRLLVRAIVKTATHAFELLGGPDGVRVSRVAPVGGAPFDVPASFQPLQLREHASGADLARWLEGGVDGMRQRRSGQAGPGRNASARVQLTLPPRNALTLARLAEAFGGDAVMAPSAPVEVFHDLEHAGTRYRFVASREVGSRFRGRLIGPSGDVWSDTFDLERFPGAERTVAAALGAAAGEASGEAPVDVPVRSDPDVPEYLMPHAGEVWVMNVRVEHAGAEEVRYVGTDIDGRPYGAARVLKRAEFEAVFSQDRGGWRLLVMVEQVRDGSVLYRQLDPRRQPMGAPRTMPVSVMVANFVPEAAAY